MPETESSRLNAAEATNQTGKSANTTAMIADEMAPPGLAERRRASAASASTCATRARLAARQRAQLMFSSAFVRENDTAEIVATMKKMMIETALARPKSCPLPVAIASLYV